MPSLPKRKLTRRARRDLANCLDFVARQPWGKPADRARDIHNAFNRIQAWPERNRVRRRLPASGLELRRHSAAQFVIIYAYFPPTAADAIGEVSIRAIRHQRVKDVFVGVRELDSLPPYWPPVAAAALLPQTPPSISADLLYQTPPLRGGRGV